MTAADATIAHYEEGACKYIAETRDVDMGTIHDLFLLELPGAHRLPPSARTRGAERILDAGCGSGRDTRAFMREGFSVTAYDRSPKMAELAALWLEREVLVAEHAAIPWEGEFDGVWACASLVHQKPAELEASLARLARALKTGGVLYTCFQLAERGDPTEETKPDGRYYQHMSRSMLRALINGTPGLHAVLLWSSKDGRAKHPTKRWINVLARKVEV